MSSFVQAAVTIDATPPHLSVRLNRADDPAPASVVRDAHNEMDRASGNNGHEFNDAVPGIG